MLNNFHLIHKCDLLRTKVPKYALKLLVRCKKIQKSKISTVTINANCFIYINCRTMKIEIHVVSTLLNNFHLIYKGDLLRTKVLKIRSEVAARKNSQFKVSFVIKKYV